MITKIIDNIEKIIVGKRAAIEELVAAFLADGHVLIEDVPGVGKTQLAFALARSVGGRFNRIQLTPDIMPSDITGFSIIDPKTSELVYKPGGADCNILLADEINRASPKTQSALLEVMEERQVSLDGVTHKLPKPLLVIATENPVETYGTYHLPEAQMDRFAVKIKIGYPDEDAELEILSRNEKIPPEISAVITTENAIALQEQAKDIKVSEDLRRYIIEISAASRDNELIKLGISPRGSLMLLKISKSFAMIAGRDYVTPDDIKRAALITLPHRLTLSQKGRSSIGSSDAMTLNILDSIAVPVSNMSRIVKIFELFFIIGLGLLVTLYVSAPVGVTILLMVFFGMFFSIAVTIATAVMKAIKVTASVSEASVSQTTLFKGEKTILKITVKNRTIIPAADVRIRLITPDSGLNADTEKNIVSFSVAGRAEEVLELEYEAAIWGQYKIGIETVRLGDFLGIFSLPWQVSGNANFEVLVFPNIIEIPPEEIIIGSALEAIYDDEAEETTETALPFGGFPGYNHRDYEPGDPIRRINWKLSAKRDKLLLRLDDEAETPEINICLTASKEALDEDREKQEEAVETALGLADLFVKLDIKVKVHYSNSLFECINSDDIANLQTAFLRYKFSDENYLPEDLSYYIKVSPNSLPELIKA